MNTIESPTNRGNEVARIRRMDDGALGREAQRRHTAWNMHAAPWVREYMTFLYRVCVNVMQERGLKVPQ
jgi:hypothetical protein